MIRTQRIQTFFHMSQGQSLGASTASLVLSISDSREWASLILYMDRATLLGIRSYDWEFRTT